MADVTTLLPLSASATERNIEQATARLADIPSSVRDVWNPATCPASLLPWLAWAFSVDQWDSTWTEEQQRASIKQAVYVQRYKGTIGAVRQALSALGYDLTVQEWFNQIPAADPYTFDILIDSSQVGVDEAGMDMILSLVDTYKNLRSHLSVVRPTVTTQGGPITAGACVIGGEYTIQYDPPPYYSDGTPALDLMIDAAQNGEASTISALDALDFTLRTTMPASSWKQ